MTKFATGALVDEFHHLEADLDNRIGNLSKSTHLDGHQRAKIRARLARSEDRNRVWREELEAAVPAREECLAYAAKLEAEIAATEGRAQ
jgi:hypothetical protein